MSHQINAACLSRQTPYWYPDRKLPPVTSSIAIWFPTSSFRVLFAVDATRSTLHLGPHPHVAPGKCQKTIISLEAKWYLGSQLTHFQPALLCFFFGLRAHVLPFVPWGQENLVHLFSSILGLGYQSSFLLNGIVHGCAIYIFSRALTHDQFLN